MMPLTRGSLDLVPIALYDDALTLRKNMKRSKLQKKKSRDQDKSSGSDPCGPTTRRLGLTVRLQMCRPELKVSKDERAWLDMPDIGRERIN
jgi:ribosomal protein S14